MNITKFYRKGYGNLLTKFRLSSSAITSSSPSDGEIEILKKEDAKISKNAVGMTIAAAENYNPMTQISVFIKAGSKYEGSNNLGISHCIRNCSILSSKNHSSLALTRHLEQQGCKLIISSTREYMIYTLQCVRDYVDNQFPVLAEYICQQAYKPWEISDCTHRMWVDRAMLQETPEAVLMEALHKVSLRGGLSNSLYCPEFMVGKHDSDMIHDFVDKNFLSHGTIVAGLGISHDHLEASASKFFNMRALSARSEAPGKFGTGELRIDTDSPITRVAFAAEGAGLSNMKESLSFGVLQCILGIGSQTPHSMGQFSKLGAAAAKVTDKPFAVSSLNISYSDVGLFGVYIAGQASDMQPIVNSVITQMRESTKNLSEADIQNGKHALKAKLLLELETQKDIVENMAMQAAVHGKITTAEELQKAIDALTSAEINAVACKVMKMKPAMVAMGQLHNTPHLEELL